MPSVNATQNEAYRARTQPRAVLVLESSPASSKDTKSATSKIACSVIVVPAQANGKCSVQFKNEGWKLVADIVRHRNVVGLAAVSTDFGIHTNSATQKFKQDRALAIGVLVINAVRLPPCRCLLCIPVIDFG
jgi:hypothetical protein